MLTSCACWHRLLSSCTASALPLLPKLGSSSAHKRQELTRSIMGCKLPFSLGRIPAASSPKTFSKGVSLARLHALHTTLLMRMEPTQATATCLGCTYTRPSNCLKAHANKQDHTHAHVRSQFPFMHKPPPSPELLSEAGPASPTNSTVHSRPGGSASSRLKPFLGAAAACCCPMLLPLKSDSPTLPIDDPCTLRFSDASCKHQGDWMG